MKSYTFIMLKPDSIEREIADQIIKRFKDKGFQIEFIGCVKATTDIMIRHHNETIKIRGDSFIKQLEKAFDGRYVIPIILSIENNSAIEICRVLIGNRDPEKASIGTIRKDFGIDSWNKSVEEDRYCNNLVHACDSIDSFYKEVELWFNKSVSREILLACQQIDPTLL